MLEDIQSDMAEDIAEISKVIELLRDPGLTWPANVGDVMVFADELENLNLTTNAHGMPAKTLIAANEVQPYVLSTEARDAQVNLRKTWDIDLGGNSTCESRVK